MKVAIVWYFPQASHIINNWRDGLRAAIDLVAKKHEVHWYLDRDVPKDEYDAIILWDDSNSEFFKEFPKYHAKKLLCLTTDPKNWENLRMLDAIFCESEPIKEAVRAQGLRAIKAFGTDTDFFKPKNIEKDIEYFYPATFSPWKRQSEIAYLGNRLTCIGTVQPDGAYDLAECTRNGVSVVNGYLPARKILSFYQRAKNVIIPAVHGSERTVLEAMSCGIKPIVTHPENVRTYSYLKELEESGLEPRDFILKNYSHFQYAQQLLKGIEE
jgi:glycosyltransferase involved in cell wall biosynthesis